ncbi:hypothetical protein BST95_14400 [Halioglobus japonicus]|uniref:DUF1330 domain-containing protein n=1 Tax=Halioglobus japonicus TaxID=930805 RepID=A0AAP8SPI2_9GAMM|nr:DUF1330 domain-containing protein [Halioglobus japonicus]AQA19255.1 hypothetical protein BST95_14400 [Halioglobus japonicus]PLW87707.1 DUF1330 domain-containing protein [Halioglobus japonicus]GHD07011.1 DUF1330 domain-containing protein [Halioglobus japonicus]
MSIEPTDEQLAALVERDGGGPINMLNLLKFKDLATYPDGSDADLSGRDAYLRYGVKVAELITALGGAFVFSSEANTLVVGQSDLDWDMVVIVNYPSVQAFLEMTESQAYQDLYVHREAGLESQILLQC